MEHILHQLRLMVYPVYPITYKVLYIPGGFSEFLNHQQYRLLLPGMTFTGHARHAHVAWSLWATGPSPCHPEAIRGEAMLVKSSLRSCFMILDSLIWSAIRDWWQYIIRICIFIYLYLYTQNIICMSLFVQIYSFGADCHTW